MASKVVWYREAWWIRTRWGGTKKVDRKIGPTKADKRQAEKIAREINAKILLGTFDLPSKRAALPFADEMRRWHRTHTPTFKKSFEITSRGLIENHLVPYFKDRDVREITESDILDFIRLKQESNYSASTIKNALSLVRRVFNLLLRDDLVDRNPAERLGELMTRMERRTATGVPRVDAWNDQEIQTLLAVAEEFEPRFYPVLYCLLATGIRRGELLGLRWEDIDFENSSIVIQRAIVVGELTTPKSGKSRQIVMSAGLAELFFDHLSDQRKRAMAKGWKEIPPWVFCSDTGNPIDARNLERTWHRVRRRAQAQGVRPLRLHCARHTYATRALRAGKSLRWVAQQLGHANPELTLRTYAHVMPEKESDVYFANFGGSKRLYPAPSNLGTTPNKNTPGLKDRGHWEKLERETGIEPATLSLGS